MSQRNIAETAPSMSSGVSRLVSASLVAAADGSFVSELQTCSINSLKQLLASAKHSQPFFVHVLPHSNVPASATVPSFPQTTSDSSVKSSSSAVEAPHPELPENEKSTSDDNPPASVSAPSLPSDAPSPNTSASSSKIRRLLQCEDEPAAKRMHVGSDANASDGRYRSVDSQTEHHLSPLPSFYSRRSLTASESGSSTSLDSPRASTANEYGFRLARTTTNIRDHWAIPRMGLDHSYHEPSALNTGQSCSQTRDWQISLRPCTQPCLLPTSNLAATQPRDIRITLQPSSQPLQPSSQPPVLSDRSNYSMPMRPRGRRGRPRGTSRISHSGKADRRSLLTYFIYFNLLTI